ncbi:hypothetical protein FE391_35295 [Nonomuraea sp. KC401]|uniref:hypothetical protein n=1 Tax=unclassified Nonomuraea TaxID=2593643 RepID=UPI0010FE2295|nr:MULTISPECIES: hypothetical protein [unclassified Nonomuraea]NBE98880.1 hypothetical protein [Nonomuraea sp. K271]TLF59033.1 hypothetical protein FE391_35295 [Nonomuraea sp. KC401]
MEVNGVQFSRSRLRGLAEGMGDMGAAVSHVKSRYEEAQGAIRAAVGGDDYGKAYWRSREERLENIQNALKLLAGALSDEEDKLTKASTHYKASDDASTIDG